MEKPSNYPRPPRQDKGASSGTRLDVALASVRGLLILAGMVQVLYWMSKGADARQSGGGVVLLVTHCVFLALLIPAAHGKKWAFGLIAFALIPQMWGVILGLLRGGTTLTHPLVLLANLYDLFYGGYCAYRLVQQLRRG